MKYEYRITKEVRHHRFSESDVQYSVYRKRNKWFSKWEFLHLFSTEEGAREYIKKVASDEGEVVIAEFNPDGSEKTWVN